ncbi:hypothetical protein HDK77DRAFT_424318 [Phyllosticta capitalensis]
MGFSLITSRFFALEVCLYTIIGPIAARSRLSTPFPHNLSPSLSPDLAPSDVMALVSAIGAYIGILVALIVGVAQIRVQLRQQADVETPEEGNELLPNRTTLESLDDVALVPTSTLQVTRETTINQRVEVLKGGCRQALRCHMSKWRRLQVS